MRSALRLYFLLIGLRIRSQLEYRLTLAVDILATLLGSGMGFVTLAAVFARFQNVGGWQLGEVAFLYGLAEVSFASMDIVFSGFDPDQFSMQVQSGMFDQLMIRPLGLPLQIFSSEFLVRRVGRLVEGCVVFGLGLYLAHIHWTLLKVLYLPIIYLSMVAFFGGMFVIGSTLCFWTVKSSEAVNIFTYGGTEMISYPMSIYTTWLRRFFTFVVPAALLSYYPALYFLEKPDPFGLPHVMSFLSPVAGFGMLAAAFAFWHVGVAHYQSTGT
jgi:ABC-2 type transport system permease protein